MRTVVSWTVINGVKARIPAESDAGERELLPAIPRDLLIHELGEGE
jgi:hypothetical protein